MYFTILDHYPDRNMENRWNAFLAQAFMPTHYTTPDFFVDRFVGAGDRFAILVTDDDKHIAAVLTGINKGKTIESGLAVRPQTVFRKGVDVAQTAKALAAALKNKAGKSTELITFYSWSKIDEIEKMDFNCKTSGNDDLIIMLDLSSGADNIFKDFSQTRRNDIRKAIKQDLLEIKDLETAEELGQLYAIHLKWNAQKGIEPDKFEDFKVASEQKEYRKVIIAKFEGKVIAGSYYRFCKGGVIEYAANNSLSEYQKLRPNDLIGWRSIEWACSRGFSHYSMGGSHLFLRRFGGYEVATNRYQHDRTFLRTHQKKEAVRDMFVKTYLSIPVETRKKIKRLAGKT